MRLGALAHPGVVAALAAAVLFGTSTPFAKILLEGAGPWLAAGLLYLGSGLGLGIYRLLTSAPGVKLVREEIVWLVLAVVAGGVVAPVLLLAGLSQMPASGASLLLNAEAVFTALLAWFVFKENFDRRIAVGMLAIVAGSLVLSWPEEDQISVSWPPIMVLAACFCWGLDNNFTRKIALTDATWLAMAKGLAAGTTNLALAFGMGASLPAWPILVGAVSLGFLAYGVSLVLFVIGLRQLGTARTGAYFSIAPFVGAVVALMLGEPLMPRFILAGVLMVIGVWLHLTERHAHKHTHEPLEHDHEHVHDDHHQHEHEYPIASGVSHRHRHRHELLTHTHEHFPDAHHHHKH